MESSTPSYTDKPPNFTGSYGKLILQKLHKEKDHLGNVLATVSDRKVGEDADSDGKVDYYQADVTSATDYYPFGSLMPGRSFNSGSYRYGFNGFEQDPEIYGTGNAYNFGERIYSSRLARFVSPDPLIIDQKRFPWWSPYQFAGNMPIRFVDIDGLQPGERAARAGTALWNPTAAEMNRKARKKSREVSPQEAKMMGDILTISGGAVATAFGGPVGWAGGPPTMALGVTSLIAHSMPQKFDQSKVDKLPSSLVGGLTGGLAAFGGREYYEVGSNVGDIAFSGGSASFKLLRGGFKTFGQALDVTLGVVSTFMATRDLLNNNEKNKEFTSVEKMKEQQKQWEQNMDTYVEESTNPENLSKMMTNN